MNFATSPPQKNRRKKGDQLKKPQEQPNIGFIAPLRLPQAWFSQANEQPLSF
ncbi:MAG: hypothetical protein NZ703_14025 [Gemmataceae bacterium]|nr:hypothetical protein [Gemmataceae bacterium]